MVVANDLKLSRKVFINKPLKFQVSSSNRLLTIAESPKFEEKT